MEKTRITITLDQDVEEWIRAGANAAGKSMSDVVRVCLREYHQKYPDRFLRTNKARSKSEAAWLR